MIKSIKLLYAVIVLDYLACKKKTKQMKSMVSKCALFAVVSPLVLVGCGGTIPIQKIDVSESIYRPDVTIDKSANHPISALQIVNNAPKEKSKIQIFKDHYNVIERDPDPRVTVEEDIKRYLEERLPIDPGATRNLRVQIDKVRIHWIHTLAQQYAGLFALAGSFEYVMQVKLSIDVKEDEKIITTYHFDDSISINHKGYSIKKENLIYKKLFAEYRKRLFMELDEQLIGKYFAKANIQ